MSGVIQVRVRSCGFEDQTVPALSMFRGSLDWRFHMKLRAAISILIFVCSISSRASVKNVDARASVSGARFHASPVLEDAALIRGVVWSSDILTAPGLLVSTSRGVLKNLDTTSSYLVDTDTDSVPQSANILTAQIFSGTLIVPSDGHLLATSPLLVQARRLRKVVHLRNSQPAFYFTFLIFARQPHPQPTRASRPPLMVSIAPPFSQMRSLAGF
ncbi:MAG: hypothetical protein JWR69_547 [Pedosphaera sp.]|nr:hypothetical protein [Pedosphaera sp.]